MWNVPEEPELPVMFINHPDDSREPAFIKFTNDPKVSGEVNSRKDGFIRCVVILISSSS